MINHIQHSRGSWTANQTKRGVHQTKMGVHQPKMG